MQNYGGGSAAAEFDPKAFLHWQPRDVIIAPMNSMVTAKGGERSAASCCSEPMRMDSPNSAASRRPPPTAASTGSLVIGDTVYMLSDSLLRPTASRLIVRSTSCCFSGVSLRLGRALLEAGKPHSLCCIERSRRFLRLTGPCLSVRPL
jgi:hypothetical protein